MVKVVCGSISIARLTP
ncbi:hypothetical protein P3748_03230 [Vibrio parahaemolyticus]|nr:hypothetical protein [Vibrio parahaemolyticus]MDF5034974.1 hypothetical protein [Vibrio parahaemolyticus]MDF5219703.1 hypothetical protein [Vibrio parahaemolyticus]MDF5684212.1 hypothetical protein [Vibrio parahaemolyticus]